MVNDINKAIIDILNTLGDLNTREDDPSMKINHVDIIYRDEEGRFSGELFRDVNA